MSLNKYFEDKNVISWHFVTKFTFTVTSKTVDSISIYGLICIVSVDVVNEVCISAVLFGFILETGFWEFFPVGDRY